MHGRNIILLLFLLLAFSATGQDTVSIKEVPVTASRFTQLKAGSKVQTFDSAMLARYRSSDLAALVSEQSLVFVKSYSPGTLATTSFRGAGAGHTAVLWNGFNLQSPMNGMLDLSLVPNFFMNSASMQYGSAGAAWGNGAVGGTILLGNQPVFGQGISIASAFNAGSFGLHQQQLAYEYSGANLVSSLKVFNYSSDNNFPFYNTAAFGAPLDLQENAGIALQGLMQENYLLLGKRSRINTRAWYQYSNRRIPPSMTVNTSRAVQRDKALRLSSEFQHTRPNVITFLRAAFFDDDIVFSDPMISVNAISNSKVLITESETRFRLFARQQFNLILNNTSSTAVTADYQGTPQESRSSAYLGYTYSNSKESFLLAVNLRQEFRNGEALPFMPSIGAEQRFLRYFNAKASASRHYRVPTLNDMYFRDAGGIGNPDLRPEEGYNVEAALEHSHQFKILSWKISATGFSREISNWILWKPVTATLWSPENVLKVWSRGLEYDLSVSVRWKKLLITLSGKYNYILSTNEETGLAADASLHKQLIYVPVQNAQGDLYVSWKGYSLAYTQTYTGYRYYSADNREYLPPFSVAGLRLSKEFRGKNLLVDLFVKMNNIFNEQYQVYAYRPMPLLNYELGLTIKFNYKPQ
jgi:iron complex outermembrane receptor protein